MLHYLIIEILHQQNINLYTNFGELMKSIRKNGIYDDNKGAINNINIIYNMLSYCYTFYFIIYAALCYHSVSK